MADDKKVFDVAKPGSAKPETGSKPMVVGHKIMKDPTLTDSTEDTLEDKQEPVAQPSKLTISPISDDLENSDKATEENDNVANDEVEKSGVDESPPSTEEVQETENTLPVETAEEKQEASDNAQVEHEENLQKIIKEKTYNVPIKQSSHSAVKTFFLTFFIVGLIGIVLVLVLVDAEILDSGITLPFDFL